MGLVFAYQANLTLINLSLMRHSLGKDLFEEAWQQAKSYQENNIYFISIEDNKFGKVKLEQSKLIIFRGFDFEQTFIQIKDNELTEFDNLAISETSVVDIDSFKYLVISNNKFQGNGNIIIFSLLHCQSSQTLKVNSNQVKPSSIASFLVYNGEFISNVEVSHNSFYNSIFQRGWMSFQAQVAKSDWTFNNNVLNKSVIPTKAYQDKNSESLGLISSCSIFQRKGLFQQ